MGQTSDKQVWEKKLDDLLCSTPRPSHTFMGLTHPKKFSGEK